MTVKTTYKCNLCQEIATHSNNLKCLVWDSTLRNGDAKFGGYVLKSDIRLSDKHICNDCTNIIKNFKP